MKASIQWKVVSAPLQRLIKVLFLEQNIVRVHPFMRSTKTDQFFDPPTPTIRKNELKIYCLKTIESANT